MHDLADIYEYICEDNERAALSVLDSVFRKADLLAESPGLGRSRGHDIRDGVSALLWKNRYEKQEAALAIATTPLNVVIYGTHKITSTVARIPLLGGVRGRLTTAS